MKIPEAALNQHIAVLGKTGSGKTYAAKGIVEHLLDLKRQVCILDPTGAWWGMRLGADGNAKGYDLVLLGGEHGDIPLAEKSAAAVARLVTQQGASVVCDTSGMTVGEYTRWFIEFAGTLYTTVRAPLHLVIDEAHYFMPQGKSPDIDAGRMLHAGNRLMSGGRSRGVRGMLITQRPAKLHKDSLTCADTLIAMRMLAPQDRGAVKEWVDGCGNAAQGREVLDSLASLKKGEGWVWYPEGGHLERTKFGKIKTYDSSAAPKAGAKAPAVGAIDLDEVKKSLADAVREAEANDPKKLRARIAELEAAAKRQTPAADPKAAEIREENRQLQIRNGQLAAMLKATDERIEGLQRVLDTARAAIAEVKDDAAPNPVRPLRQPTEHVHNNGHGVPVRARRNVLERPVAVPAVRGEGGEITRTQQRVLDAAAFLHRIGHTEPKVLAVGLLAGIDPTGGHFSNTVGPLSTSGLIVRGNGSLSLTDTGRAAANTPEWSTLADYHAALRACIDRKSGAAARIFDYLVEIGPRSMTTEEIGAAVSIDHTGGHFSNSIGPLGTLGLIRRRAGTVEPTDILFPEGLA